MTDIEISRNSKKLDIREIAKKLDLKEDDLELYGKRFPSTPYVITLAPVSSYLGFL